MEFGQSKLIQGLISKVELATAQYSARARGDNAAVIARIQTVQSAVVGLS